MRINVISEKQKKKKHPLSSGILVISCPTAKLNHDNESFIATVNVYELSEC